MRTVTVFLCAVLLGVLTAGCSGMGASTGVVRKDLGTTAQGNVNQFVNSTLLNYGYEIDRAPSQGEYKRYLTYWKQHAPLEDEQELGYDVVRTRIIIVARPKNRTADTYRVTLRAEYSVKQDGSDWRPAEVPEMRLDEIEKMTTDLSQDLSGGVLKM